MVTRVFPDESMEKPNLHVDDLKKLFNKKAGFTRMDDVDVVRVCLLLLVYAGFLGREARQPIPRELIILDYFVLASDPGDANTNSTTLFSDDTADKSRKATNPEMRAPIHLEDEFAAATVQPPQNDSVECRPRVPGISDRRTASTPNDENAAQIKILEENLPQYVIKWLMIPKYMRTVKWENCSQGDDFPSSSSVPDSLSLERSSAPASMEFSQHKNFGEDKFLQELVPPRNKPRHDVSGLPTQSAFSYYMSGAMNQVMMPPSAMLFQNNLLELQNHASSGVVPQYNHLQHCHSHSHVSGMASFPYYPVNMCMQPGPMLTGHSWPSVGNSSPGEVKPSKVDRREAALIKFRQKRKERCFDKKILY
ncbi:Detected protein of confused Function [Hibiscus syriacus]|uniref:Detected protein of confused Function n=1 Tax=Hibiscus syriacus TaxID=106335 RepID=A0A6A2Y3U9_HIBSY|nr:Detected protein of confused Function [Hibiscus syriacus]